jgi:predicted RNase H-like HicB family nuclease
MKREFYVIIERDESGMYVGEVPSLQACYAQGKTIDELLKNIEEVIALCLESQRDELPHFDFIGVQKVAVDDNVAHV